MTTIHLRESEGTLVHLLSKGAQLDSIARASAVLKERRSAPLTDLSPEEQCALLLSRSALTLSPGRLLELLAASSEKRTPLRVKFGIDPTTPLAHLGHAVPVLLAHRLQRMGHHIIFIIGDVTAKIGDPSGRNSERPPLTHEEVKRNLSTYQAQFSPLFDFTKAELRFNSEWLTHISAVELLKVLTQVPLSMQLQREDFRQRLNSTVGISTAELLYSVFMGLDSVHCKVDIELGGIDQLLNFQMCRKLMECEGLSPEVIIATGLIEGTDGSGAKMSKSKGNFIGLNEAPNEMFGKVMSIPDRLIESYFKSLTEMSDEEWSAISGQFERGLNPMMAKKVLAFHLVDLIHSPDAASSALAHFDAKFSRKDLGHLEEVLELEESEARVLDILKNDLCFITSRAEGRRLAKEGAIRVVMESDSSRGERRLSEDDLLSPLKVLTETQPLDVSLFIRIGRRVARIKRRLSI